MIQKNKTIRFTLAALLLLVGSVSRAHEMSPPEKLTGVQSFDVDARDGKIHVLTLDVDASTMVANLNDHMFTDDGKLSPPSRVASNVPTPNYGDHAGDDVQVAAFGDHVVALWQIKGTGWEGCGPMVSAVSSDGERTWRPARSPADDGKTGGHGFIDVTSDASGVFHAVWLDDRRGHQSLWYARSADFGASWSKNILLRDKPCQCCWNKIATAGTNGVYVLFRDQHPRDMAMAVSSDGGRHWNVQTSLGGFGWNFDGCPHVGGGLDEGHALIWTGKDESVGLYHASVDAKGHWHASQKIAGPGARHGDIATDKAGRLAAVWDAYENNEFMIQATTSNDHGKTWAAPKRLSPPHTHPTHPRVVASPTGFRIFWTDTTENGATALSMATLE
jgi:hypothetical protein